MILNWFYTLAFYVIFLFFLPSSSSSSFPFQCQQKVTFLCQILAKTHTYIWIFISTPNGFFFSRLLIIYNMVGTFRVLRTYLITVLKRYTLQYHARKKHRNAIIKMIMIFHWKLFAHAIIMAFICTWSHWWCSMCLSFTIAILWSTDFKFMRMFWHFWISLAFPFIWIFKRFSHFSTHKFCEWNFASRFWTYYIFVSINFRATHSYSQR